MVRCYTDVAYVDAIMLVFFLAFSRTLLAVDYTVTCLDASFVFRFLVLIAGAALLQ